MSANIVVIYSGLLRDVAETLGETAGYPSARVPVLRVPADERYEGGGAHPAGNYPFRTRDFGSMVKGAVGILHTAPAPAPAGVPPASTGGSSKPVLPSMIATSNSSGSSSMGAAQTAAAAAGHGDVSVAMATCGSDPVSPSTAPERSRSPSSTRDS